nr:MAG TPA: hypothetical protein [Caudoviricetes sp.]
MSWRMHMVKYSFSNLLTRPPPHYGSALWRSGRSMALSV